MSVIETCMVIFLDSTNETCWKFLDTQLPPYRANISVLFPSNTLTYSLQKDIFKMLMVVYV